jgi:TolB-like protein
MNAASRSRSSLAKAPADRFGTAGAFVSALSDAFVEGGQDPGSRPASRRRIAAITVAGLVAVAAGAALLGRGSTDSPSSALPTVVVTEFRNTTGDPALDFLGEAAGRGVSAALTALTTAEARPYGSDADGADYAVTGSFRKRGESLEYVTELMNAQDDRALAAPAPTVAPLTDPLQGLELLGERTLAALSYYEGLFGGAAETGRPPPSYEAYLEFERGLRFLVGFRMDSVEARMRHAIALEPIYTEAYLILGGGAFVNQPGAATERGGLSGRYDAVDSLARVMRASISPWTEADEAVATFFEAEVAAGWDVSMRASVRLAELLPAGQFGVGYAGMRANRQAEAVVGLEAMNPDRGWIRETRLRDAGARPPGGHTAARHALPGVDGRPGAERAPRAADRAVVSAAPGRRARRSRPPAP